MPLYEYICQACEKKFDVRASITEYSDGINPSCPDCGSNKVERGFSAFNFLSGSEGGSGSSGGCGPSGFS